MSPPRPCLDLYAVPRLVPSGAENEEEKGLVANLILRSPCVVSDSPVERTLIDRVAEDGRLFAERPAVALEVKTEEEWKDR